MPFPDSALIPVCIRLNDKVTKQASMGGMVQLVLYVDYSILRSLRRGMTASLRFSANCTDWEHRRGSSSSLLFLGTSVCMGHHRRSSPMSSSTRLISSPGLETPSICFLTVAECPSDTAVPRRRSGLPCYCCPYSEQSAPTCDVRTLYVCFLPEGIRYCINISSVLNTNRLIFFCVRFRTNTDNN